MKKLQKLNFQNWMAKSTSEKRLNLLKTKASSPRNLNLMKMY